MLPYPPLSLLRSPQKASGGPRRFARRTCHAQHRVDLSSYQPVTRGVRCRSSDTDGRQRMRMREPDGGWSPGNRPTPTGVGRSAGGLGRRRAAQRRGRPPAPRAPGRTVPPVRPWSLPPHLQEPGHVPALPPPARCPAPPPAGTAPPHRVPGSGPVPGNATPLPQPGRRATTTMRRLSRLKGAAVSS